MGWIFEKEEREEIKITAIRFMWIPGIRPVNVPMRHPSNNAIIISISIYSESILPNVK